MSARYTCDGANHSPPLAWTGSPPTTAAYALTLEDPDAPDGAFVHWIIYDIPAATPGLPEGLPPDPVVPNFGEARQGQNGFGRMGYSGPCPPRGGVHRYHFRLIALARKLGLDPGAPREQLASAMRGAEIGRAELVGTYVRR